jgi:hypothetical protein
MELTDEIAISLTVAEWNQILLVLAEGAFRIVAPLITKINEQANAAAGAPQAQPPGAALHAVAADC